MVLQIGMQQLDEFVTVPGVVTAKTNRSVELSVRWREWQVVWMCY